MTSINQAEADPALSIPMVDPIGRLYRYPTSEPLPMGVNGGIILPSWEEVVSKINSEEWVPSITNILGVRNAPYLMDWAAREAAKSAIDMESRFPGRLASNPTGALRYLSTTHDRNRDDAADQGTRVHYACEMLSNDQPIPEGLLAGNEWEYVKAWKKWQRDFQPKFIHTEMTVFGKTSYGNYAGTTDFLCEINGVIVAGDIKTTRSGIHDDVAYQLSAVTRAVSCTTDGETINPMPSVDAAYVLHLSPYGYKFVPVDLGEETWNMFVAARGIWNLHALDGVKSDGSHIIKNQTRTVSDVVPFSPKSADSIERERR